MQDDELIAQTTVLNSHGLIKMSNRNDSTFQKQTLNLQLATSDDRSSVTIKMKVLVSATKNCSFFSFSGYVIQADRLCSGWGARFIGTNWQSKRTMVNSPTERHIRNTRKGKDFMVASGISSKELFHTRLACPKVLYKSLVQYALMVTC